MVDMINTVHSHSPDVKISSLPTLATLLLDIIITFFYKKIGRSHYITRESLSVH